MSRNQNNVFRLKEYLCYFFVAKGKGNMHSPFVFDFMKNVLYDKRSFYAYEEIENLRLKLLTSNREIELTDYGTGTFTHSNSKKSIRSIVKTAVKPAKQAQLLFRIIDHFGCNQILEAGTSLGITTLYLASASKKSTIITLEGDPLLAEEAKQHFKLLEKKNIQLITGRFEETLQPALQQLGKVDFIFFDGHHRKEPTLNYFKTALPFSHEQSIFVFDDIHWSEEMKEAWKEIQLNEKVTLTIDLFYFGIIFFSKGLSKQNFTLRF